MNINNNDNDKISIITTLYNRVMLSRGANASEVTDTEMQRQIR